MARTKTNTKYDTKPRKTPWRNRHLEKNFIFAYTPEAWID